MTEPLDDADLFWSTTSLAEALGFALDRIEENGYDDNIALNVPISRRAEQPCGLSLALRQSLSAASGTELHVLYATTQHSSVSWANRLIGSLAGLSASQLDCGRLRRDEWNKVGDAVRYLQNVPLHFYDYPMPSLDQISIAIAQVERSDPLGMIVIDSIKDLRDWSGRLARTPSVILKGLSELVKSVDPQIRIVASLVENY